MVIGFSRDWCSGCRAILGQPWRSVICRTYPLYPQGILFSRFHLADSFFGYTVHGFRTSFTEYVAAETDFPDDLADRCIAHERRGKVRRAYQRSDLLKKRREI